MTLPALPVQKKRKSDTAVDLNPKDRNDLAFDFIGRDNHGNYVQFRFVPFNPAFI